MVPTAAHIVLDLLRDHGALSTARLVEMAPGMVIVPGPADAFGGSLSEAALEEALGLLARRGWIEERDGGWRLTGRGPGDHIRLADLADLLGVAIDASDPRPYLDQEWFWDVRAFVERLTQAGYDARRTSVAAPLIIEGRLPLGTTFSFRWEYGGAQLEVAVPEWLAIEEVEREWWWSDSISYGKDGDWSVGAGERAFHELIARYLTKYDAQ